MGRQSDAIYRNENCLDGRRLGICFVERTHTISLTSKRSISMLKWVERLTLSTETRIVVMAEDSGFVLFKGRTEFR